MRWTCLHPGGMVTVPVPAFQDRAGARYLTDTMQKTILLHGKAVHVELTVAALRAAGNLDQLLVAEIHLIFGCLILKRVRFMPHTQAESVPVAITDRLSAGFRVIRYAKSCRISHIDSGAEQPMDFPLVADKRRYVPDWLKIDFNDAGWTGHFGYGATAAGFD